MNFGKPLFRLTFLVLGLSALASGSAASPTAPSSSASSPNSSLSLHGFKVKDLSGQDHDLGKYKGQVVLVVNTASKCGLTPQYNGLERVFQKYKDRGFTVIGFPSNDFWGQEPGTAAEIQKFCDAKTGTYKINFPLMEKTVVKGASKSPLYTWLTSYPASPGEVSWNFEKFLINKKGAVVARFTPRTDPEDPKVLKAIELELAE